LTDPVAGPRPESARRNADHAGDPHDLPFARNERDVLEAVSAQSFYPQERRWVGAGRVLRREGGPERAPDNHGEEVGVRYLLDRGGPPKRAVAQNGDTIGDLANLAEPVGDVDNGRPASCEFADEGEEEFDGILREWRRRLVENQEPRRHGEGLGDLEEVAAGDAERRDAILEMS
jgi:hypothetical protein